MIETHRLTRPTDLWKENHPICQTSQATEPHAQADHLAQQGVHVHCSVGTPVVS